ncbi:MAG: ATP-binding cassette protein [Proteobacteria bacterium]|nr:ATP-binding cassette protein [Pseudomonadota bacterium]
MALFEVRDLAVSFATPAGEVDAVAGIDLEVAEGECLALVGESGSGKSQALLACLGLLAANGRARGEVRFDGRSVLGLPERELGRLRGAGIGYVFQDAPGSLTPHLRIGDQLSEALRCHHDVDDATARAEARRMLERVQVPDAAARLRQYPHELSGGTRQRAAIAAALMPRPRLLIADEPTTALDVTVQAQVIALFRELRRELGMALVVVTHDLGVVAGLAERVAVMYSGRIVEEGATTGVLSRPAHPYTSGLLAALPRLDDPTGVPMRTIPGTPPAPGERPRGCAFAPRCDRVHDRCRNVVPALAAAAHGRVACHRPLAGAPA